MFDPSNTPSPPTHTLTHRVIVWWNIYNSMTTLIQLMNINSIEVHLKLMRFVLYKLLLNKDVCIRYVYQFTVFFLPLLQASPWSNHIDRRAKHKTPQYLQEFKSWDNWAFNNFHRIAFWFPLHSMGKKMTFPSSACKNCCLPDSRILVHTQENIDKEEP